MFCPQSIVYLVAVCIIPTLCAASNPPITAAPDLLRRQQPGQDSPSCSGFYSLENSCSSLDPNFYSQNLQTQLDSLCYTSSTWAGSLHDGYFDTCLAYLSIASPTVYSELRISTGWLTTPCEQLSPTATSAFAACVEFSSIEASCAVETSNFEALPLSSQFSCLCYSSSTYAPSRFDNAWDGCLLLVSSFNSSYYATIAGDKADRTPCANAGNVRSGPTAATTAAPSSSLSPAHPLTTTEPQPTGASGNGATAWGTKTLATAVAAVIGVGLFLL